jgi:SAM-dependent methyltransferase
MSLARLHEHRQIWARKTVLAPIYNRWFDAVLAEISPGARVLELGAGPGFFAARARAMRGDLTWVSSELIPTPWNQVVADAHRLPLRSQTFDALVGLDVLHHLARPGDFFQEAARVLRPAGRIVMVEPWITPASYPIYRFLHQERCSLGVDAWAPFGSQAETPKDAFDGDSAIVWALARRTPAVRWAELGFAPPQVRALNNFAYVLSLGFKRPCLLPAGLTAPLLRLEDAMSALAPWLGARALVSWRRVPTA